MSAPLAGLGVLVTRPQQQAADLCRLLNEAGATVIRLPTLAIRPPLDPKPVMAVIDRLAMASLAIFTSANAVHYGWLLIQARFEDFPSGVLRLAIGKATAKALQEHGAPAEVTPPPPYTSEALLALPQLRDVAGQRIIIVKGEGGRDVLGVALSERGALVSYADVYRRERPQAVTTQVVHRWVKGDIGAVVTTSNEGLQNLFDMIDETGRHCLRRTPLVVISPRAGELARQLAIQAPVLLAREAGDAAIVEALIQWYSIRQQNTVGSRNDGRE